MTAPAVAVSKPRMIATYKEGHELAGMNVERGRECGCGRWFPQQVLSPRWLDVQPGRREAYRENSEVVPLKKGELFWFPKRCHRCERRKLDADALNS